MAWQLVISTKGTGEQRVDFPTEDEAQEALGRAAEELKRVGRGSDERGVAMFEGRVVVPAQEILAISIREASEGTLTA